VNDTQNDRILVTYASRRGSTRDVAQAIAQTFRDGGAAVDMVPIADVTDLTAYQAVIVGSAIRFGRWLPEAVEFVTNNRDFLSQVPTAFFTVCMTLHQDTEENRRTAAEFLEPVRAILTPTSEGWFAGNLVYREINLWQRTLARAIKFPEGDFRNWEAIRAWAEHVMSDIKMQERGIVR
jgi:menaquinone-dependent protoporphyrinogen oxidase